MKVLVLATSYPHPDGHYPLQYIHSRNQLYIKQGIDVSVVSFDASYDYELEGVSVYTLQSYTEKLKDEPFDLLISHAPNVRHHYRFIKSYGDLYEKIVFFFHGHEVLKTNEVYPKPYDYAKKTQLNDNFKRRMYDWFKLRIWRHFFNKHATKCHFVFVSEWMYKMFLKFVKTPPHVIEKRSSIIYNCVGFNFESFHYDDKSEKLYDFLTIRNFLDGSKYAIDIVTKLAHQYPEYRFCVIGEGEFYKYNEKPDNLNWINRSLHHDEMLDYLNKAKCALIPTRVDSQGVMACEMATFGMPLITSNIEVSKEIFSDFENVGFINNHGDNAHFKTLFERLVAGVPYKKNEKYFLKHTILKEVQLFKQLRKE